MSASGTKRNFNNSSSKDKRQQLQDSQYKRQSNQDIDQSGVFSNKNDEESTIEQNKSLYSLKNSQYLFDRTSYKKGSILMEEKSVDYYNANNVKTIIMKERKTPTDLINLGAALKNYWFFDDYKKTLPFSNYLSLLKSIEYQFVKKGEIVYSIGQRSTEMYVILEGSFFVLIRNPKSLVVYNTPKAAHAQLEQNQHALNNNIQQPQNQQQEGQQAQDQTQTQTQKEAKNVDFSQAWEYIEQQTLQDEINKKMQEIREKDGPLEWYEICDELSDTILVDSLKLGNNFGEFEMMYNKLRSQIIIAREDSHIIKISQQQYEILPKEKNQKQYNASLDFLYSFDFFHDWGRQMMNLLVCFEIADCYLNQVIYKEQEESDYLYFVYSGEFEVTKKIRADENHQKVLELANIPLFNYKKNIKSQIKTGGDYSERVRLCIYGPNTYFGDEELLNLEKRQTQATCISQEAVLYKLSLKKLVKIVCNQNNIWELLQNNLKVKRKWQKQFFSQLHEMKQQQQSLQQNDVSLQSVQKGIINADLIEDQKPQFLSNVKFQSKFYYKGCKDNYVNNIQNVYQETANNIINLQQKKSFSPRQASPSIALKKKDIHDSFTQHMKNISDGNSQNMHQLSYNDDYITQNSPIQTTRYFNLKQELLNKQFFQDRSKNLIEMQQNMVLVKRFKEHQKQLKKIESNQNQPQELLFLTRQIEESNNNNNQKNQLQPQLSDRKYNGRSPTNRNNLLQAQEKDILQESRLLQTQQGQRKKNAQNTRGKEAEKQIPKSENQLEIPKEQIDRSSIIRREDLAEYSPENFERNRKSSENGIQIDLRIFHENTNEENFEKKKNLWDHLQNSKEKITTQKFYDQLMDAVNGGRRPQTKETKGDIRSKTIYKGKAVRNKQVNQSLNASQVSSIVGDSSIQYEKSNYESPTRSITPLQDGNSFRQYYNQNKDKQIILDKLRFHRLMRPHIDEKIQQEQAELQQGSTLFSTQIQLSPLKQPSRGSQTSRDHYRSRSNYNQSANTSRRASQILELQQELFGNISVLKQQQFLCLGNQQKQNNNISQNYNESIDTSFNSISFGLQNQISLAQSIIPNIENDETMLLSDNRKELLGLSPLKRKQYHDDKLYQKKIELHVNNKLNIPSHNRVYKEGDNIYIKTGGFTIKKPCPQRFINQI